MFVWAGYLSAEFVVPFSSRSLALKLSTSLSENIIIWVKTLLYFTQMIIFSPNTTFWTKKVSFDNFFMLTWEWENKSDRKKKPQIPSQRLLSLILSLKMSNWTNKQTKVKLFCKFIESFDHGSAKIRNGDFQTGFFGAERDKTLVMTGIHKWSHAQYFTTRLHLIFNCTLSSVELRQQRHAWPKLECPETFFFCFAFTVQPFFFF